MTSETGTEAPRPAGDSASGITRRSALKRAAVAGTVVWAAPVMTSAWVSASAASQVAVSPCGLPGGDPCLSQSICGGGGANGCNSMQLVDLSACFCAQAVADCNSAVVCLHDSDCNPAAGERCALSCCTDANNNFIAVCVAPC